MYDVVCNMCIIGYIGSTTWFMDREVDVGLNLTMCIEIGVWVWKLSWRRSLDNCLVGLGDGTRKVQTRFVCNISHVPGRWRINPILNKFLALDWILSVMSSLILPVPDPSDDDFVINSISSRAATATFLRWSSSSCSLSNSRNFVCISISRRCLATRRFASSCFSNSSLLSFESSQSCWRWLYLFEEVICELDLEWWEVYSSAVSL